MTPPNRSNVLNGRRFRRKIAAALAVHSPGAEARPDEGAQGLSDVTGIDGWAVATRKNRDLSGSLNAARAMAGREGAEFAAAVVSGRGGDAAVDDAFVVLDVPTFARLIGAPRLAAPSIADRVVHRLSTSS